MYLNPNFKTHFGYLENQLATSPNNGKYLCGDRLTGADILMSFPLISGQAKVDRTGYPKLVEYTKMLQQHESYRASVQRVEELTGEPFKAML